MKSGGVDEVFTRTDSTGAYSFLRDGLGSTAALTDSTGATQQTYSYNSYGSTSSSGNTTSNSYEYLGRETDASGLYYFRNRYYNPVTQTFISEDPMRLAGGPNLFQYAGDNPTTYRDPNGNLFGEGCALGVTAYSFGQIVQGLFGRKTDSGWNAVAGALGACALGEGTEGIAPAFEALDGAFGILADELGGLGPEALETEDVAARAAADQFFNGYAPDSWTNTTLQPGSFLSPGIPRRGKLLHKLRTSSIE